MPYIQPLCSLFIAVCHATFAVEQCEALAQMLLLQTSYKEGDPSCIMQGKVAVDPWALCTASKQCTENEVGTIQTCDNILQVVSKWRWIASQQNHKATILFLWAPTVLETD